MQYFNINSTIQLLLESNNVNNSCRKASIPFTMYNYNSDNYNNDR